MSQLTITLPDGKKMSGKTDADGWVKVNTGQVKGECKLRLPENEPEVGSEGSGGGPGAGPKEDTVYRIQLTDDEKYKPLANVPIDVLLPTGQTVNVTTGADGFAEVSVPHGSKELVLTYTPQNSDTVTRKVYITYAKPGSEEAHLNDIKNMGFWNDGDTKEQAIARFQAAHPDTSVTGELDQKTKDALEGLRGGQSMQEKLA